jgi:hypothetical protein
VASSGDHIPQDERPRIDVRETYQKSTFAHLSCCVNIEEAEPMPRSQPMGILVGPELTQGAGMSLATRG